jgi:hypothetical protein
VSPRRGGKRWRALLGEEPPRPTKPRKAEVNRPLPEDWRPRASTEEEVARLGFKLGVVLALFRKAMTGSVRKRWTDQTFAAWFESTRHAGAFPRASRVEAR